MENTKGPNTRWTKQRLDSRHHHARSLSSTLFRFACCSEFRVRRDSPSGFWLLLKGKLGSPYSAQEHRRCTIAQGECLQRSQTHDQDTRPNNEEALVASSNSVSGWSDSWNSSHNEKWDNDNEKVMRHARRYKDYESILHEVKTANAQTMLHTVK